jgi:esterase/lipase
MIHGLNLKPDKMGYIAGLLNSVGIEVLGLGLRGHNGDEGAFAKVTKEQWIEDALEGYRAARARADEAGAPLYFVGFSLGGLLGVELATSAAHPEIRFDRMLLLAPALTPRSRSYLVRAFGIFGSSFTLPSLAEPAYRANRGGTSIAAYRALFGLVAELEGAQMDRADVPTLVFIDPEDELVSESGLARLIAKRGLDAWELREISAAGAGKGVGRHHLIVDEESLGPEAWRRMAAEILAFFAER